MDSEIKHIHMVGICGTAMGAVAMMLAERGYRVTGSDARAYPPMSNILADHGISIIEGFHGENLDPAPDLVIIGNAMSRGNDEVEAVLDRRLRYTSLAEALKEFFLRGRRPLVVTGTHGKTTTSSMLAWILEQAGREPGFMIGGVPENFDSGARIGKGDLFVVEGDEYDTAFFDKRSKFVHYLPECVIVNNIEFDHADIFDDIDDIELSFRRMLNLVPGNGLVVANARDERVMALTDQSWAPRVTFGVDVVADWQASELQESPEGTKFELRSPHGSVECSALFFGKHNVSNAVAAAVVADHVGLSLDEIVDGIESFGGVKRRMQRLEGPKDVTIYDDFAHHPTAIGETLHAVRAAHPDERVWALFEPRSNTTVRSIFQRELADALSGADMVVIGGIHRSDSIPEAGRLDIERLADDLTASGTKVVCITDPAEIITWTTPRVQPGDVIVLMSNGAFGGLAGKLPQALIGNRSELAV
jgi:UDP-N-acetylmuramate: L-alanyl-gamma-D-glutamyl-meso-diaminopimelate ligase